MNRRRLLYVLGFGSLALFQKPLLSAYNKKPNIVLIFVDDMGWPAISCYGNKHVSTPNIDRLAKEGMKFMDAYVTPQCTPSRAALLTGQHTARNGMWHVIGPYYYPYARVQEPIFVENLPRETFTMAKALKACGYKTAHLGKWHLTNTSDGYYTYLHESGKEHYGFDYVNPITDPPEYTREGDKGVDFLTDEAIQFMRSNRDNPFFIYLSHHTLHGPVLAPQEKTTRYLALGYPERGIYSAVYLAAIEHLDQSIGRLLDEMDELQIANDTIVCFLTDNGGVDELFDNSPLRYGKGSVYEGGIRVPLLIRWPNHIKSNSVCSTPVHIIDFYPTFLEIAGEQVSENHILDGESLVPILKQNGDWPRDTLYWFMPLYDKRWGATPAAIIREGDYKLIHFFGDYIDLEQGRKYIPEGRIELYNLREDISETNDLSSIMLQKKEDLLNKLHIWMMSLGHDIPKENPNFDISRWDEVVRPNQQ